MLHQSEDEQAINQIQLSDSQFNEYIRKIDDQAEDRAESEFSTENQLQPLIYATLQLEYNIFLNEEELRFYKTLLIQKESKIKQLRERVTKRNSKVAALVEGMKRTEKRIKEVGQGYKHIVEKHQESLKNENGYRNRRLECQQRKTHAYKKLCELQNVHQNYINSIYSYQEYDQEYNEICSENQRMREQIQQLQNRFKGVNQGETSYRRDELKAAIKKLYERIKLAEKEENDINQEYENKKKRQKVLEKEQFSINSKNVEINALISRISKVKQECSQAQQSKQELEKEYRALLSEQSFLKKSIAESKQRPKSRQMQDKSRSKGDNKAKVVHNFKIIDSEADEQLKFNSMSQKQQNNSTESQGQLDDLISRFERIKGKSKTRI